MIKPLDFPAFLRVLPIACVVMVTMSASSHVFAGTYITINGQRVPQEVADAIMQSQLQRGVEDSPMLRQHVREEVIRRTLLVQDAKKKKLHKDKNVAAQMKMASDAILIRALAIEKINREQPSDASLREDYEAILARRGDTEYKLRHILLGSEDEAQEVIEKLKQGEKFGNLVTRSTDTSSAKRDGQLGWNPPTAFVKPFADALVNLKKGQHTNTPVKSDFGYHVILLDDVRKVDPPSFEKVKPQLLQRVRQEAVDAYVLKLLDKAKIK